MIAGEAATASVRGARQHQPAPPTAVPTELQTLGSADPLRAGPAAGAGAKPQLCFRLSLASELRAFGSGLCFWCIR